MRRMALCLAAALLAGCPAPPCDALRCSGCCDESGQCRGGATVDACGSGGGRCGACAPDEQCVAHACFAPVPLDAGLPDAGDAGAPDAGGTPPDAGTAPDAGCLALGALAFPDAGGAYRGDGDQAPPNDYSVGTAALVDGGQLRLEVWHAQGAPLTFPLQRSYSPPVRYAACDVCVLLLASCDGGACALSYLAQAGTVQVSGATRADAGGLAAQATALRLVSWDLVRDQAAQPAACAELDSLHLEAHWP